MIWGEGVMKFRVLGILMMGLLLVACGENEQVTEIMVITPSPVIVSMDTAVPTTTPTPEPTIQLTATQEPTATVTETPTLYPTPTMRPTSTLLVPTPHPEKNYELAEWTAERANQLITKLQHLPETLHEFDRGYQDNAYYSWFSYAAFAQSEALVRFPESEYTVGWEWGRAFNYAQVGENDASDLYITLFQDALNNKEVDIETLPAWLSKNEQRLELNVIEVPLLQENVTGYLVELKEFSSGMYMWILKSQTGYEIFPLKSGQDFGFASAAGIRYEIADLTGDGVSDIIINQHHQPGSINFFHGEVHVFDVSQTPPRSLFSRGSGRGGWTTVPQDSFAYPSLHYETTLDYYFCPEKITWDYIWDGTSFKLVNHRVPDARILYEDEDGERPIACGDFAVDELFTSGKNGDLESLQTLETLIPDWPFLETPDTSTLDAKEAFQFKTGFFYAMNGYVEQGRQRMEALVQDSELPESQWGQRAELFLEIYQTSNDFLEFCTATQICDMFLQDYEKIEFLSSYSIDAFPEHLTSMGMPIKSYTFHDFDKDGFDELLLVVERDDDDGTNAYLLGLIAGELQITTFYYVHYPANLTADSIFLEMTYPDFLYYSIQDNETQSGILVQNVVTKDLPKYSNLAHAGDYFLLLEAIANELFNDSDPNLAIDQIETIINLPVFQCGEDWCRQGTWHFSQYLLGLAHELAGNDLQATSIYYDLWQNYPTSPYAMMARAKLQEQE